MSTKTQSIFTPQPPPEVTFEKGRLYISDQPNQIVVLCDGREEDETSFSGTVIGSTPGSIWSVGNSAKIWDKATFIPYKGKVTLTTE